MRTTDQMLARLVAESEEKQQFIDGLVEDAEKHGRDLNSQEMELATRARNRLEELNNQIRPLKEMRQFDVDSRAMIAEIAPLMRDTQQERPREIEYRSAGDYALDMWRSGLGDAESKQRLDVYNRAASHQTTADSPGLIPTPILGPVVDFIDASRPLVNALGPRQLPGQNWSRPKVTVHTTVGVQSAEKAELTSQKMTITKLAATASTYGGYVNVSRQSIDFTQPGVMDLVITDLAAQYAIQTEAASATAFNAAATAGTVLPTGPNQPSDVSNALWAAAAAIYTGTKGAGTVFAVIPPGLLAIWGGMFPPVNPFNQQSPGFNAGNFGSGLMGQIAGIPIFCSPALSALPNYTSLVFSTAAAEVYEERIGSLQVVEPSVLGVQVAYAGYFTPMVIEPLGIIKVVKTP
jgi:HK97 family phage major capsid protein